MSSKPSALATSVLSAGLLLGSSACEKHVQTTNEVLSCNAIEQLEDAGKVAPHSTRPVALVNLPKPTIKTPFNINTFSPGPDMVEVERHTQSENAKTVVYILDYHSNSGSMSGFQKEIQGQIYATVNAMIDKYGSVPLSAENWLVGDTAESYLGNTNPGHTLYPLFNENNPNRRAEMVLDMIERFRLAGPVIIGAHPDEAIPLGSITEEDITEINEIVQMDNKIIELRQSERSYCTGSDERKYSLEEAKSAFEAGGNSDAEVCYCAVHVYEDKLIARFRTRLSTIPVREVQSATAFDHSFSVVIAGLKHYSAAKKELDQQGVNYVVLTPKALAPSIQERLNEDPFRPFFPDNEKGTCETLIRTKRAAISKVLEGIL